MLSTITTTRLLLGERRDTIQSITDLCLRSATDATRRPEIPAKIMTRWRPPAERSSPYITPQGYATLEKELRALWKKRRIVNDALSAAAKEGDRSENAEYIYRKKEQHGIDRRIRYLQKRLPDLNVVDKPGNRQQIFFGASVTLENMQGEEITYRIVGPDETDAKLGYISIDSPLARALLKKQVDDEVKIKLAGEDHIYLVVALIYP